VVVFVKVHLDVEVSAREEIEIIAAGVETGVDVVIEIVGDRVAPACGEAVNEDLAVAVGPDEAVTDPVAVRGPAVIADLPGELVVLHLVRGVHPDHLFRRDVDVEDREVLVAEQDLTAFGRPGQVIDEPVEARCEGRPLPAPDGLGVELVIARPVRKEGDHPAVRGDGGVHLARPRGVR
jgi:hypothetical protein